ncbi:hypothetical protein OAL67_00935 [bacterium]|nr:hypothetical protein [bacterium]
MKDKRVRILLIALVLLIGLAVSATPAIADKPIKTDANGLEIAWENNGNTCTKIQDGTLETSAGDLLTTGFDEWGYNYQGHIFNGGYCDAYRDAAWCQPYKDVDLIMKWNDAWLANTDCDDPDGLDRDGLLDRHYGFETYIGSGAWTTNHQSGEYELEDGTTCNWNYFVKIVAAPADAELVDGIWYNADGTEIGPVIWGAFAIIQEVENDPCAGIHGLQYSSPDHVGLGGW